MAECRAGNSLGNVAVSADGEAVRVQFAEQVSDLYGM
jgi:hypothetical protein